MERALKQHDAGVARVIPVIIKACDWTHAPFARLRPLPSNGTAVASWPNKSEAWAEIARGTRAAVQEIDALFGHAMPRTPTTEATAYPPATDFARRHPEPLRWPARPSDVNHGVTDGAALTGAPGGRGIPTSANNLVPPFQTFPEPPQKPKQSYARLGLLIAVYFIMVSMGILVAIAPNRPVKNPSPTADDSERELLRLLDEALGDSGGDAGAETVPSFSAEETMPTLPEDTADLEAQSDVIAFYEDNRAAGRMLGRIADYGGQRINLTSDRDFVDNDKARSCVLHNVRAGAVISIFDSPDGDRGSDWAVITVKKPHPRYTLITFESNIDDDYVQVKHMRRRRLDGRVSRIEID